MDVKKIYFDMDDTIADFGRGLREICKMEPIPQDKSTDAQDDAMWAAIREAGDFYYRLEECRTGMMLFQKLRALYGEKVEILTAIPKERRGIVTAADDKNRWVKEHIDEEVVVNIAYSAEEKKEYCTGPDCFLVDDLKNNIDTWRENGGTGIWFLKDDPARTEEEVEKSTLANLSTVEFFEFDNPDFGTYDVLAHMSEGEAFKIMNFFGHRNKMPDCLMVEHEDEVGVPSFMFFIDSKNKILTPVWRASYAYGGMYGAYGPIGKRLDDFDIVLEEYSYKNFNQYEITRYSHANVPVQEWPDIELSSTSRRFYEYRPRK